MPYIIEQANVLKNNHQIKCCSLVIDDNRIDYISENISHYHFFRMPANEFVLTAGHVMLDFSFQEQRTFAQFKQYVQQHFISRGCTTLLAVCDVRYEKQLPKALQQLRQRLLNSPIDYFIGVKIPLRTLTPSFVRKCRRYKIPIIFIELDEDENLASVPWHWIYEALSSYFIAFSPYWKSKQASLSQPKKWRKILKDHQIPFIPFSLKERTPLSLEVLKKIGIYPQKGDIRIGGEVDYNLYEQMSISHSVAEKPIVDYDNHVPTITVHKGRLLKAGEQIYFYPGFGKELVVRAPGMFAAHFDERKG
jgi:hypothetical protein